MKYAYLPAFSSTLRFCTIWPETEKWPLFERKTGSRSQVPTKRMRENRRKHNSTHWSGSTENLVPYPSRSLVFNFQCLVSLVIGQVELAFFGSFPRSSAPASGFAIVSPLPSFSVWGVNLESRHGHTGP